MQIHPVVSRLCASIQGTSPQRLADCLGIDSSKVKLSLAGSAESDWQDFHSNAFLKMENFSSKLIQVKLSEMILPAYSFPLTMKRGNFIWCLMAMIPQLL